MGQRNQEAQGIHISKSGFDDDIIKLVHLARFYFTAYSAGEELDYIHAVDICCKCFGAEHCQEIAINMYHVLSTMRESRTNTFHFNSNRCNKCCYLISDCERLLFSTVANLRDNKLTEARVSSMILCEGNDTEKLYNSINKLLSYLPKH